MIAVRMTDCPEITELLSVLEQNGLHKERDDVNHLVNYLDGMESKLSELMNELSEMRKEVSQIHDNTLRAKCSQFVGKAGEKLKQTGTAILTLKNNFIRAAGNAVKSFREKGLDALRSAMQAMKIPNALEALKSGFCRSADAMQESAGRVDGLRQELHEVWLHLKNAGRTLLGKPTKEAVALEADKGALAKLRSFMERMSKGFSAMEQSTDALAGKLRAERDAPVKAESRDSVKSELRDIKSEHKKTGKAPALEQVL